MVRGKCSTRLIIPIFLLCSGPLAFGLVVEGTEGQTITLPCSYKVRSPSDITTMCWGRGSCPNSKCNQRLIETDGRKVTVSSSNLYQLRGDIANGQVSLTIVNARLEDQGTYCCRIEHAGWFNDDKLNIQLKVYKAPPTTRPTIKPTTRPTTKPATRPKAEPTTRPTTKPATRPKAGPTTRPTTKPATQPKAGPTTRPTTKPATQPKAGPTTRPTTKPATQPKAGPTTRPTTMQSIPSTTRATPFSSIPITDIGYTEQHLGNLTTEIWKPNDGREPASSDIPFEMTSAQSSVLTASYSVYSPALSSRNVTAQKATGSATTPYVLITIISASIIVLLILSLLVLKLRGKERGRYLLHMDPSLELVAHGEDQTNEKKFSFAGAENTDANKIMVDEDDRNALASKKAEWEGITGPSESEAEIKDSNGDLKPSK
ncbi:T-cell immunoglobulin and mucin domain-containing protein 4-like [Spea bombifrons]|uniref:T-cell immunoglobulin and mucin domain-containing protein 4-like n=1 Tax=Spea bombifrons TaxID=233779 RepID=UPI00234A9522|nr:T-cell immunoglobulin and mucin domain-containing protein 4-like [Spea bombifrons]